MRGLRNLVTSLGLLVALALAGSFLGAMHPAADSLAVIRPALAVFLGILGALALSLGAHRFGVAGLIAALLTGGPVIAGMMMAPSMPRHAALTIYSKNLWAGTREIAPLLADIRSVDPDVVLLQEVSEHNHRLLGALADSHPHQHRCAFSRWNGLAIVSRWPLDETACSEHRTLALARIDAPGGPVWAGSVHLVWPFPYGQARFLSEALPVFERIRGRAVLAGDFNMVPWGYSVRRIARATGTARIGRIFSTFAVRGVPLPIDHVLTTGQGVTERRGLLGSDHHGVAARIAF